MNAAETGELTEGTRLLDRYTIIDRVGSGGMASIYRALDERLDRVVCVKLLRLVLAGSGSGSTSGRSVYEATYAHFLQEALALSRLQHPNTLRIYDFGYIEENGQPFQISEFLDGGDLEQYIRARGALTPHESSAILERITGAVAEAHEHKIIHRDIKPSNIIFGRMGEYLMPKLADFGIAHSNLRKRSHAGGAAGWDDDTGDAEHVSTITLFSPRWASPEQLAGSTQGAATDVYALGLVAVYMLVGKPLFQGNDVRATFDGRVRNDDLIAGLLQAYGLGEDVCRVLLRALAAMPERRYPTPGTFFDAFQRVVAPQTIPHPPSVPPEAVETYQPRKSVTLSVEHKLPLETQHVAPPEQAVQHGSSRVRMVDVHEKLDLSTYGADGGNGAEMRFRVSYLPARGQAFRLHVKGLNCFVKGANGRPTPAIVVETDAVVSFLSTAREELGHVTISFGTAHASGRVFRMDSGEMVVPSTQATQAVALYIGRDRDVIIMCRR